MSQSKTKCLKVKVLNSFSEKTVGLIGKKPFSVYFETRGGIHTFGMLSPIDVVILDKDNKVVKLKKDLKPNRLFFWNPKYFGVLELPPGTVAEERIKIGAEVRITERSLTAGV